MPYKKPSRATIDFAALMSPVALKLLGEPNSQLSKPPKDVRFGTHGSMAIDFVSGKFYDHEHSAGGGVIDLVKHRLGCDHIGAVTWLRKEGFLNGAQPEPSASEPAQKMIAEYDYVDEAGNLLFQVVRFEPKAFKQRRPTGEDWTWKLGDVRRVPFRLPELTEGIAAGHLVVIVEGEKDVLALNKLGVVATTNPGGAGKWRPEFSELAALT
jgi:hypothetical protein